MKETKSSWFLHCWSSQRLQDAKEVMSTQDEATPQNLSQAGCSTSLACRLMVDTGRAALGSERLIMRYQWIMLPSVEWRLKTQVECKMVWNWIIDSEVAEVWADIWPWDCQDQQWGEGSLWVTWAWGPHYWPSWLSMPPTPHSSGFSQPPSQSQSSKNKNFAEWTKILYKS